MLGRDQASVNVRRATRADIPQLAQTLARAFLDDPVAEWSCRSDRLRPAMLERFHSTRMRQLMAHEEIWTTDTLGCAALWAPPKHWKTTPREDLEIGRVLAHPRLIWRLPLLTVGFGGMEKAHPHSPPHWYLAVLGTMPNMQGQGLGSAVLAPVLEQCDSDGVAAYLESSKETNIAFYGRHGFRVTGEIHLPRGPKMWQMWRDPRS